MNLKQVINQDLKQALLGGDKLKSDTLRIVKSVILNEEIAQKKRQEGLSDQEIIVCLQKEIKKRQEAADLYVKAGSQDRADKELAEKSIIAKYLPEAMDRDEIGRIIDDVISHESDISLKKMGLIIGQVKNVCKGRADGSVIADIVKAKLEKITEDNKR